MPITITNAQSRRLILNLQALAQPTDEKLTPASLTQLICRLGFVQIDSIRWVERAQHMILFSRSDHYQPDALKNLIEVKRKLFENYTHDASVIPCEYFHYWLHKFRRDSDRIRQNFIKWQGAGFLDRCEEMLQRIHDEGPLMSRDLNEVNGANQEMWQWNDRKTALEYMWRTGTLAIAARRKFEKVYDLIENAIPEKQRRDQCDESEFIDWACRSALDRLGIGSPADIASFWKLVTIAEVRSWIAENSTQVEQVVVETASGQKKKLYARPDIESCIAESIRLPKRVRIMSPFDPVIRDRKRLSWMFDFEYRIEIYVPAQKRKYGYYVFPILDGEQIAGRIDMKAERESSTLVVKNLWLESTSDQRKTSRAGSSQKTSPSFLRRLSKELTRQATLADVSKVDQSVIHSRGV